MLKLTSHPVRITIYEGEDGPQRKSMNVLDFVEAGRFGMVTGKVGKKE